VAKMRLSLRGENCFEIKLYLNYSRCSGVTMPGSERFYLVSFVVVVWILGARGLDRIWGR
jgi:hypothetical protein